MQMQAAKRQDRVRRPGERVSKGWLFLLPMAVFAFLFQYWPFLQTAVQSLCTVNFRGDITGFAGLENFRYLFSRREFSAALRNTLVLTAVNVPVTLALTLLLAWMTARRRRLSPLTETLFALPMAVSMASVAMIFRVLLNPTVGYVNYCLGLKVGWLTDRHWAMPAILIMTVWMGIAFNYLLFLSAFRAVPKELTDSASLEGAGPLRLLFSVQLPLISPTILYVVCTNTVQAMMTNGPVLILTQGGPARSTMTLIYLMYTSGYGSSNYSLAACVSLRSFGLTLLLTLLIFTTERGKVHYQ